MNVITQNDYHYLTCTMNTTIQSPRVFGIGFQKTATSSLGRALEQLGYRVHGPFGWTQPDIRKTALKQALTIAASYDAVQDFPWALIYRELDDAYPGSKFILTLRDDEAWFASMMRHFGVRATPMRAWAYDGIPYPRGHKRHYIRRYNAHTKEVCDYFSDRPNDLLIMDITQGDGWDILCPFLDCTRPDNTFPYANAKKERRLSRIHRYMQSPVTSVKKALQSYCLTAQTFFENRNSH